MSQQWIAIAEQQPPLGEPVWFTNADPGSTPCCGVFLPIWSEMRLGAWQELPELELAWQCQGSGQSLAGQPTHWAPIAQPEKPDAEAGKVEAAPKRTAKKKSSTKKPVAKKAAAKKKPAAKRGR